MTIRILAAITIAVITATASMAAEPNAAASAAAAAKLPDIRRIVARDDAHGISRIAEDAPSKAVITVPARPGYRVVNLWKTDSAPALIGGPDLATNKPGIAPAKTGGTILRVVDFPPEVADPAELRRQMGATFGGIFKDAQKDDRQGKHPGMHRTETVDYAVVLEGEVYAVMDEGETLMRAGDVLIQDGTNHAWANRSNKTARILFVLMAGERAEGAFKPAAH
jgi:mannose-6-phosphate isomerase-like protein (cupin superfamily)